MNKLEVVIGAVQDWRDRRRSAPRAKTAGEQDHTDPWVYAGDDAGPPRGLARSAAAWRNCRASLTLLAEINRRWPKRDKASDGAIGDAAHATRESDHNPWVVVDGVGVVRARDIDKDGIDAAWLAEYLRLLGKKGDRRLTGGGYIIFNQRITTEDFSGWKVYTGTNPHTKHVHVSFSRNRAGFDSVVSWGIAGGAGPISKYPRIKRGDTGEAVKLIQRFLGVVRAGEPGYGEFGPTTEAAVKKYQAMRGLEVDGIVGPATWSETGL